MIEDVMNNNEIIEATAEAVEEAVVKPYTLRRLKDRDLFPILGIVAEVFPEDLASVLNQIVTKEKTIHEVGVDVVAKFVTAVLKNIHKVHDNLYALLSDISGIPAEDIEDMEFGTTPMMIWDIIKNEKNAGFFKVLSKLS